MMGIKISMAKLDLCSLFRAVSRLMARAQVDAGTAYGNNDLGLVKAGIRVGHRVAVGDHGFEKRPTLKLSFDGAPGCGSHVRKFSSAHAIQA